MSCCDRNTGRAGDMSKLASLNLGHCSHGIEFVKAFPALQLKA